MDDPRSQDQPKPTPLGRPNPAQLSGVINMLMEEGFYDEPAIRFYRLLPRDPADILSILSVEHLAALIDRISLEALAEATEALPSERPVQQSTGGSNTCTCLPPWVFFQSVRLTSLSAWTKAASGLRPAY